MNIVTKNNKGSYMKSKSIEGKFILKSITKLSDLSLGEEIRESALCFQEEGLLYQFKYKKKATKIKFIIKPGFYVFAEESSGGLILKKTKLKQKELLTSVGNAQAILSEAKTFFSKLHIYDELEEPKARKILLYSAPGMGKSSTITSYCHSAVAEDAGTVVMVWPTAQIPADWVLDFLDQKLKYTKKCTRVILIMEDIGGNEREGDGGSRGVDSSLLDLLDGLRTVFKLPTFMIATTNYPQNLLSALADRPGRFDKMLELEPPTYQERVALMEFIAKRSLNDEEKEALNRRELKEFSVAHLKEVVIRSMIHEKSIPTVIKELIAHKKRFKDAFEKKDGRVGFGDE
jgi:AAA+ superfamily predicted ATPase